MQRFSLLSTSALACSLLHQKYHRDVWQCSALLWSDLIGVTVVPLVLRPRDTVLLECPTSYIQNTADSDRNGDYGGVMVGEKRFFEDFVSGELDDTDQPRSLVGSLVYGVPRNVPTHQGIPASYCSLCFIHWDLPLAIPIYTLSLPFLIIAVFVTLFFACRWSFLWEILSWSNDLDTLNLDPL